MISRNLEEIKNNIKKACENSRREYEDVKLIAVSKTKPIEMIEEAYSLGVRDFGENKVQELISKKDKLPKDINWHFIGHLQTNKVKQVIDKVSLIHSIDSIKLAFCINEEAKKRDMVAEGLLEVNVAKEESKFGFFAEDLDKALEEISKYKNLKIKGLMTIAPFVKEAKENREIFNALKKLSIDIEAKSIDNVKMDCLSMGMSNDYMIAIEEGADFIRVGSDLFGER